MAQDDHPITDEFDIHSFFRVLNQNKGRIWLWQHESENRVIQYAVVRKVDLIKQVIHIGPCSSKGFKFKSITDFFFYHEDSALAFKFTARDISAEMMLFPIPKKIQKISRKFLKDIELIERENEDKFKHLRDSPRIQVSSDQSVSLKRIDSIGELSHQQNFFLYDVSGGGMGFQVNDPSEFDIGEKVQVVAINSKDVPKKMTGEVVSVRQNSNKADGFKVGVKFLG